MGLACKRCGSEEHTKNGLMRGKQRYRCKACGLNFTDTPPRGMPLQPDPYSSSLLVPQPAPAGHPRPATHLLG